MNVRAPLLCRNEVLFNHLFFEAARFTAYAFSDHSTFREDHEVPSFRKGVE
jgi:hypothetical protein